MQFLPYLYTREGRQVYENLKKVIAYSMSTCFPQLVAYLAFIVMRIPLPIAAPLVIMIDMGTNVMCALGMSYEKPEADIMGRAPRNANIEKLLTGKMFFFAILQVGFLECCAGFYAYCVTMNDYGYPPHILMGRGDGDYWGNYPLYCQFIGGQYVNPAGEIDASDPPRYPSDQPPRPEFPLWDEGDAGYVKTCAYPVKNFNGGHTAPGSKYVADGDFYLSNALAYFDNSTLDKEMTTVEAIEALEAQGYYEYIPWKGRVSRFWRNNWDSCTDTNGTHALK